MRRETKDIPTLQQAYFITIIGKLDFPQENKPYIVNILKYLIDEICTHTQRLINLQICVIEGFFPN